MWEWEAAMPFAVSHGRCLNRRVGTWEQAYQTGRWPLALS